MKILIPLLISSIAGLSTVLGSLVIFFNISKKNIDKFITFCLSFSLSVMICISITDLIPNSTFILLSEYNLLKGVIICLISFIIGVISINIINKRINKLKNNNNLYKLGILSMVALMLHNLPEGIATFMSAYKDINLGISLGIAILLHNIPEGVSISVPIYYATHSKWQAIKKTLISGLAEPLGAILAYIFLAKYITNSLISIILLFVAGLMITLAINELLPQALTYKKQKYIIYGLLSGIIIVLLTFLI